ncbi:MAG: tetratricopeptide repeat protein [Pyrinomonadaceae bacterium]
MRFLTTIFLFLLLSFSAFSQAAKPKSTPLKPKPKPTATPTKKPDEKTAWDKAAAIEGAAERVKALQKFNETYPKSTRRGEAIEMIATARGALGNEKIDAKDLDAAIVFFKAAVTDAPKPIGEKLWTDTLSKIGANLFFRGKPAEAIDIIKILEEKAVENAAQMLDIAAFYMSIENGTEAKRIAGKVIAFAPNSAAAYQTLGLANRIDFQLEDAAAAYAKALELDPDSLTGRRGLAEMSRATGKADEAVTLYREILAKETDNVPAQTGLILALFDSGKKADAEAELAKSLEANPGNVILLASAAYWYAANKDGDKAVDLASKAIAADPRFIWSHLALARGLLIQGRPTNAEKAMLEARQYGNFPTVEYEMAAARLAAGYYREAADGLARNFSIKDGLIQTKLGGRIARESKNFSELVGYERRASIFAPTAADDPENAVRLTALLELKQTLDAAEPNAEAAAKLTDDFIRGDDKMRVHRQIFVASLLLEKKVALPKILELTKAAASNVDAGLDVPNVSVAVMASELYDARAMAASKGEYIQVPDVARATLSSILRGRIEEISGWAAFQMDNSSDAVLRLKRAVGVLPADSAWWRSSMWRLGAALSLAGKDAEALDAYIKVYKSGGPDVVRYTVIEGLYKRVNGNIDGLADKIGPNPAAPAAETTTAKVEPVASPTPDTTPTPEVKAEPTPEETKPAVSPTPSPTPEETPKQTDEKPKETAESSGTVPALTDPVGETKPCVIDISEEVMTLSAKGGDLAVIVGVDGGGDLDAIKAISSSPDDVSIRRDVSAGVKSRAIFVLRSISAKAGIYQVRFDLPCGKKDVTVNVR